MDKLFDRLGELLRSFFNTDSQNYDRDFQEAWEELNDYLRTGQTTRSRWFHRHKKTWTPPPGFDESIRQDYANLDLPPGAPFEEVKHSYKNLLKHYHPDRFALDPEKQRVATQITQKINESFQRIREFYLKYYWRRPH